MSGTLMMFVGTLVVLLVVNYIPTRRLKKDLNDILKQLEKVNRDE